MKRIITIIAALASLVSCVDLLQKPQNTLTTETIVLNDQVLESLANGLYKDWWGENYGFNCRLASLSLAADDMMTGDVAKPRLLADDQMRVPVDNIDVSTLWKEFYKVIFSANNMIELIESNTTLPKEQTDPYLGEAKFMRALMYFYIVRLWGDAPAITDSQGAADINGNASMPRVSVKDIYDKIIVPDAKAAENLLPAVSRDVYNQGPTIWAAKMLLADVYLNMAGWPLKETKYYADAAEKALDVVDNSPHSLMPEYKSLWLKANSADRTEHIFALNHTLTYLPSQYAISYLGYEENGWSDYCADPVFFANYPDDKRKEFNFVLSTIDSKSNQEIAWGAFNTAAPYIRKYRNYGGCATYGIEGDNTTRSSLSEGITPIYRYADALLFYAEASCKAEGAPNEKAYKCLNDVRDRAFGDQNHRIVNLSAERFEKAVFDEFGWENAFEFKRWFQLVRTEKVDEMLAKNLNVEARVNVDKQNYLFPIPVRQAELRGWQNNPGY